MANKKAGDPYSEEAQKNARKSRWYSDIASTVTKCPFCDLKEKYIIYEDSEVVLTVNLFPYTEGHLMIVPRRHVEKVSHLTGEEWASVHHLTSLGFEILRKGLKIKDLNLLYREGTKTSGSSLKHLHIHLLPVTEEFMEYRNFGFTYKFQDIEVSPVEMAAKLRKICRKIVSEK